jgi:hydrogenase large subunit
MEQPGWAIHDASAWPVPPAGEGMGLYEAPRGALGHWIRIHRGVIEKYQAVVPSTWNASPRDEHLVRGPYEQSLIGIEVANPEQPLPVVRTIRSFDPCLACAVHLIHPRRSQMYRYVIDPVLG